MGNTRSRRARHDRFRPPRVHLSIQLVVVDRADSRRSTHPRTERKIRASVADRLRDFSASSGRSRGTNSMGITLGFLNAPLSIVPTKSRVKFPVSLLAYLLIVFDDFDSEFRKFPMRTVRVHAKRRCVQRIAPRRHSSHRGTRSEVATRVGRIATAVAVAPDDFARGSARTAAREARGSPGRATPSRRRPGTAPRAGVAQFASGVARSTIRAQSTPAGSAP